MTSATPGPVVPDSRIRAAGASEAVVDEFSRGVKSALHDDLNLLHPTIEEQFAAALAG